MGMIEQFEKVCNGLDTEIEHLKHKSDTATALNMSSVASSYEKQVVICRDALALIRQQQARIAELEEAQCMMVYQDCLRPDWISVKDMLPAGRTNPITLDFEEVLCATTFGDVRAYKYGKRLGHTDAHFWHGAGIMDRYVTHWKYMPEPPKEEAQE